MGESDDRADILNTTMGRLALILVLSVAGVSGGAYYTADTSDRIHRTTADQIHEEIVERLTGEIEHLKEDIRELRAENRALRKEVSELPPDDWRDKINSNDERIRALEIDNARSK